MHCIKFCGSALTDRFVHRYLGGITRGRATACAGRGNCQAIVVCAVIVRRIVVGVGCTRNVRPWSSGIAGGLPLVLQWSNAARCRGAQLQLRSGAGGEVLWLGDTQYWSGNTCTGVTSVVSLQLFAEVESSSLKKTVPGVFTGGKGSAASRTADIGKWPCHRGSRLPLVLKVALQGGDIGSECHLPTCANRVARRLLVDKNCLCFGHFHHVVAAVGITEFENNRHHPRYRGNNTRGSLYRCR